MIEIKLTERELNCLIGFMEVDEDIFKEIIRDDNITDQDDYSIVILNLLNKFWNVIVARVLLSLFTFTCSFASIA